MELVPVPLQQPIKLTYPLFVVRNPFVVGRTLTDCQEHFFRPKRLKFASLSCKLVSYSRNNRTVGRRLVNII